MKGPITTIILLSLCQLSCARYPPKSVSPANANQNSQSALTSNPPGQPGNSNIPIEAESPSDPQEPSSDELEKAIPETVRKRMACSIEEDVTITPDGGGPAPLKVTFDATKSSAPCGKIVKWTWRFGDGSKASGARVTHIYKKSGEYLGTLEMRDSKGNLNYLEMEYPVVVN